MSIIRCGRYCSSRKNGKQGKLVALHCETEIPFSFCSVWDKRKPLLKYKDLSHLKVYPRNKFWHIFSVQLHSASNLNSDFSTVFFLQKLHKFCKVLSNNNNDNNKIKQNPLYQTTWCGVCFPNYKRHVAEDKQTFLD